MLVLLGSCTGPGQDADAIARRSGLAALTVEGDGFRHKVFLNRRAGAPGEALDVYVEGDGVPWRRPDRVADDPTPHHALALELMAADPGVAAYLGRPCYFGMAPDPGCTPALWTGARYGPAVLRSMAAALERLRLGTGAGHVRLIGYSGGGVLAVLLAARVPEAVGVITLSADLDTAAWAAWHGFSPLDGSANPADEPPLPAGLAQLYLFAGADPIVPPATAGRYLARAPAGSALLWPAFGHVCCWVERWPAIIAAVRAGRPPDCAAWGCRPLETP